MEKNSNYTLYIILLIFIAIIAFLMFGTNLYLPYSDIGREVYITEQVKNGAVLYKDIFNVYSPLSYWLNALVVMLCGSNFYVFFVIGLIISILTIIPIFLITNEYTNKHIAFFTTLLLIITCTYYPSISNWITPYSYAILYALMSTIWSFWFLYNYIKTEENKYLYLSSFFAGLSVCFKYEFIGFIFIILGIGIYKKEYIKPILFTAIAPVLCLIILFVQGCTLQTLSNAFNYIVGISQSKSAIFFYEYAGILPSTERLNAMIANITTPTFKTLFAPICYINIIFLLIALIRKQKELSLLLICSIVASIKSFGAISLEIYGTYFLPLLFIGFISFLYGKGGKIKTIILSIICVVISSFYAIYGFQMNSKLSTFETTKGRIDIPFIFMDSTLELVNYINNNIDVNSSILILPEGAIINFITDNPSDNYLYYLIPPNNDVLGRYFIEEKIKSKKIDYILTTNVQYPWFNEKSFMTGWGNNYLQLIKKEYKLKKVIGENLKFYIFKHDIIK